MGSVVSSERTQSGFPSLSWGLPSSPARLPGDSSHLSLSWALTSSLGSRAKISPMRVLEDFCIHLTGGCRHLDVSRSAILLTAWLSCSKSRKKKKNLIATEAGRASTYPRIQDMRVYVQIQLWHSFLNWGMYADQVMFHFFPCKIEDSNKGNE